MKDYECPVCEQRFKKWNLCLAHWQKRCRRPGEAALSAQNCQLQQYRKRLGPGKGHELESRIQLAVTSLLSDGTSELEVDLAGFCDHDLELLRSYTWNCLRGLRSDRERQRGNECSQEQEQEQEHEQEPEHELRKQQGLQGLVWTWCGPCKISLATGDNECNGAATGSAQRPAEEDSTDKADERLIAELEAMGGGPRCDIPPHRKKKRRKKSGGRKAGDDDGAEDEEEDELEREHRRASKGQSLAVQAREAGEALAKAPIREGKGFDLLRAMGWSEGTGLGVAGRQGRVNPISPPTQQHRGGLGGDHSVPLPAPKPQLQSKLLRTVAPRGAGRGRGRGVQGGHRGPGLHHYHHNHRAQAPCVPERPEEHQRRAGVGRGLQMTLPAWMQPEAASAKQH